MLSLDSVGTSNLPLRYYYHIILLRRGSAFQVQYIVLHTWFILTIIKFYFCFFFSLFFFHVRVKKELHAVNFNASWKRGPDHNTNAAIPTFIQIFFYRWPLVHLMLFKADCQRWCISRHIFQSLFWFLRKCNHA